MKAIILDTTEKLTFNGKELGFVLDEKNEDGTQMEYYPFFQSIVTPDAIGKHLVVVTENGSKTEEII